MFWKTYTNAFTNGADKGNDNVFFKIGSVLKAHIVKLGMKKTANGKSGPGQENT